jgi:hypothetical protein
MSVTMRAHASMFFDDPKFLSDEETDLYMSVRGAKPLYGIRRPGAGSRARARFPPNLAGNNSCHFQSSGGTPIANPFYPNREFGISAPKNVRPAKAVALRICHVAECRRAM